MSQSYMPRATFECGICREAHNHESDLLIHLIHDHAVQSNHEAIRSFRYMCPICRVSYHQTQFLDNHMAREHRKRPQKPVATFECGYCPKSFYTLNQLLIHRRFHTNIKPHKCGICLMAFHDKTRLKEHLDMVHNRRYRCEVCPKNFASIEAAQIHQVEHYVWKPYLCPDCGANFRLYQQLRKHIDAKHDGNKAPT